MQPSPDTLSAQLPDRSHFTRSLVTRRAALGLAGFGAVCVYAGPKILRRLDRFDPQNFALPGLTAGEGRGLSAADLIGAPSVLCFWAS